MPGPRDHTPRGPLSFLASAHRKLRPWRSSGAWRGRLTFRLCQLLSGLSHRLLGHGEAPGSRSGDGLPLWYWHHLAQSAASGGSTPSTARSSGPQPTCGSRHFCVCLSINQRGPEGRPDFSRPSRPALKRGSWTRTGAMAKLMATQVPWMLPEDRETGQGPSRCSARSPPGQFCSHRADEPRGLPHGVCWVRWSDGFQPVERGVRAFLLSPQECVLFVSPFSSEKGRVVGEKKLGPASEAPWLSINP